jgi:multiple sugar transport system permease protein
VSPSVQADVLPPPHNRSTRWRSVSRLLFVVPAALYVAGYFGYPLVKNTLMSFQAYTTKTFFTGEAPWVGFQNFSHAFHSNLFLPALWHTALFTVGSIVGQFIIGLALAVFFSRRFPLNKFLRGLLLLPWLLPSVASSAVWRSIFEQDNGILNRTLEAVGIINEPIGWLTSTHWALLAVIIANVWAGIPFNATILYGGLQEIPEELYEAAALDGATGWRTFRHITLPLLRPVTSVVLVLGVVYTVKTLDGILALTNGGPANATQTVPVRAYLESFINFDFGLGAAYNTVLIVISLVFALIYLRANRRAIDE